jgi:restriction endonuclease Mrr
VKEAGASRSRTGQSEFVRWFGPLLDALRALGGSAAPREALDRIAATEKVPDTLRNEILKSGQERFYSQVHWARQYLVWEGLIKVVFQCKKWEQAVPPKEIRDLRGAMDGRAEKGIFMTTSTFSTQARGEAERPGAVPIELVDGEKLFEMFKHYELGLKPRTVYDIDFVFFDQFK